MGENEKIKQFWISLAMSAVFGVIMVAIFYFQAGG